MTVTVLILPIRYDAGLGWQVCATHRAQQWGVVARRRGHRDAIILRAPTKARAEQAVPGVERMFAGPLRRYRLGARMGAKPSQGELT